MALDISQRDFRTPSLEPGDYAKDERLDRSVLGVALGVVGGGMAFLLGMVFLLFPERIRPIAFGPAFSEPRIHAVLLRPDAAADKAGSQETPFHQARGRNLLIDNLSSDRLVPLLDTAQTPSAIQPVSVNLLPRGQASARAPSNSTGQTFGRNGGNTPSQPIVLPPVTPPPANAQPVPLPNTGTQQGQPATPGHGSGKKLV